jgi:hypothetical protein
MRNNASIATHTDPLEYEFSEPQCLLPAQFYAARRGASETEPWRRLMAAMLIDAVRCYQAKFQARQAAAHQRFEEAQAWIFSDRDDGTFSFRAVCDALEVDPQTIRKALARWKERRLAGESMRMIRRPAPPMRQTSASQRVAAFSGTSILDVKQRRI